MSRKTQIQKQPARRLPVEALDIAPRPRTIEPPHFDTTRTPDNHDHPRLWDPLSSARIMSACLVSGFVVGGRLNPLHIALLRVRT